MSELLEALRRARESGGVRRGRKLALGAAILMAAGLLAWQCGKEPTRALARVALEEYSMARVEAQAPAIRRAAEEFALDPNLIAALIYAESRGRVDAVSSAGALGLMQLMPPSASDAARALGLPEPSREDLLSDPALNIRLGSRHLRWTLDNEGQELERALCAYNAGRGRLRSWIDEHGSYAAWRAKQVEDGDSMVLAYALKVLDLVERFRARGTFGAA